MITDNKWIDLAHHHMNANRQQDGSINTIKAILDFAEEYSQSPVQPAVGDFPSDRDVAIELTARYSTGSRANPAKREAFIDCYNWIKSKLPVSAPVSKQSAGMWVKASERPPKKSGLYNCKWIDSGIPDGKAYSAISGWHNAHGDMLENLLWLDEAASTPQPTRTYKYFIEDTKIGKWLCLGDVFDTSKDINAIMESQWTDDPNWALKFDTKKEAEDHNNKFFNMPGIIVTEHEFVDATPSDNVNPQPTQEVMSLQEWQAEFWKKIEESYPRASHIPEIADTVQLIESILSAQAAGGEGSEAAGLLNWCADNGWYRNGRRDEWYQIPRQNENKTTTELYTIFLKSKK